MINIMTKELKEVEERLIKLEKENKEFREALEVNAEIIEGIIESMNILREL